MADQHLLVGTPVERVEDHRHLCGHAQFVDDLVFDGMLHASIVRSQVAHGHILSIDVSAARAMPGVHDVIIAIDIGSPVPTIPMRLQPLESVKPFRQPVIAQHKVRYVGEPVAIVLADSLAQAEDAADVVIVEIDPLPVVADRHISAGNKTLLFEETGTNSPVTFTGTKGDTDAAFHDAPYTLREKLGVQRQSAMTMETRGVLAVWDAARAHLTVYGAAKVPYFTRRNVASMLGLQTEAVDLIENDVGGGFGSRGEFYPEDFLIPFAARYCGRPVKWIEDRRENLLAMNHARQVEGELEIACDKDGRIRGIRGTLHVDIGAYPRSNGLTAPRNVAQFLTGPYHVENIRIEAVVHLTNKMGTGTYRAPGRFEGNFFCERLIEMAAHGLGIDTIEMRRRNLIAHAQMPYSLANVDPADLYAHSECDSGDYHEALQRCLEEFDWVEKRRLQGQLIDGRYHGLAVGCFIEGGAAGPRENARIELNADGSVSVYVGSTSLGQGLETVLTQIAADALHLPLERVRIFHGSTTYLKEGFGSYHSRSTVMGGSAILLAAEQLKYAMRDAAARRLGCAPSQITLDNSAARGNGQCILFTELASEKICGEAGFENHHKHTYAYGSAAAHVALDPKTGHIELIDYLVIEDVGRIINPLTLHGQVIGATVQGLGSVFMEEIVYDEAGQMLSGTLADYLVPTATDYPNIRAIALESHPSPTNPLGAKGAGEGGIIGVGGVVANAVAAALAPLGAEPRELPLSPTRIWHLIQAARTEGQKKPDAT